MSLEMKKWLALAMMMGGISDTPVRRRIKLERSLREEYELIKQKKSKLSANQRKWIVSQFE